MSTTVAKPHPKKPPWLKVPFPGGERYSWIKNRSTKLKTEHSFVRKQNCPNIGECWNGGTATFMLMGDTCTRGCRFVPLNLPRIPVRLTLMNQKNLQQQSAK